MRISSTLKITNSIAVLLVLCSTAFSQITFQKSYSMAGNAFEYLHSVQQTVDDGYIIGGGSYGVGAGGWDAYLINMDHFGNIRWTKHYGGNNFDFGYSAQQTTDGGYILAGYTTSFGEGNGDAYLVKTDTLGEVLWTKTYGGDSIEYCYGAQQTTDGGYIVYGYTESFGMGSGDAYLIKTDAVGDTVWTKTYGGDSTDWAYSVQQTLDGGYIISGTSYSYGAGNGDIYLVKADSVGDTIWTKTFGGTNVENGYSVAQTSDGGYVVTGQTSSFGAGGFDAYMIKVDSAGTLLFANTYGNSDHDVGRSIRITNDGGYVVGGFSTSFGLGDLLPYIIKTDSSGVTEWTKVYNAGYCDQGISVAQTSDDGYIIVTSTVLDQVFPSNIWPYLIKTDASGNSGCSQLSTNTITGSTSPLIGSGANIGSGGIANSAAIIVNDTIYIDTVFCYNLICNLSITDSIIDVNCNGGSGGSIDLSVISGSFPYTFAWSNGDVTEDVDNLISGTYEVIVTDYMGCVVTDTLLITEPSVIGPTNISINVCDGDSVLVSGTYQTTAGTYYDSLIDINGCDSVIATELIINPLPTVNLGMDTLICNNCSLTLDAGAGFTSYTWSVGSTLQSIVVDSAGSYSVQITDTMGCVDGDTIIVDIASGIDNSGSSNHHSLNIYPNPNTGQFVIKMSLHENSELSLKLYHFTGQLIISELASSVSGEFTQRIDLSTYVRGIYYLHITTDSGIVTSKVVYQ